MGAIARPARNADSVVQCQGAIAPTMVSAEASAYSTHRDRHQVLIRRRGAQRLEPRRQRFVQPLVESVRRANARRPPMRVGRPSLCIRSGTRPLGHLVRGLRPASYRPKDAPRYGNGNREGRCAPPVTGGGALAETGSSTRRGNASGAGCHRRNGARSRGCGERGEAHKRLMARRAQRANGCCADALTA